MPRFIKLLNAMARGKRCPHTYWPWNGGYTECTRTHYHWGKHRGHPAPGATFYWRNEALPK